MEGKRLLLSKMVANGISRKQMAEMLGIRVETFSIKLNTGGFKCSEAIRIKDILNLSVEECYEIFFALQLNDKVSNE